MTELKVTKQVFFRAGSTSRRVLKQGRPKKPKNLGRIPRVSRLMAMAIRMQALIRDGEVESYAELARLCHVTTARITQIMNLLRLAPDIQEDILFLPPGDGGRDAVTERALRSLVAIIDWRKQRKKWEKCSQD